MRRVFKDFIEDIGKDESVILIVGDVGGEIVEDFANKYPKRFFNFGICEQTIIGIAAGMAKQGFKPYIYGTTPFFLERAFEQIKIDIDFMKANVKIIGYEDYASFGQSHQCLDEVKLLECFDNIFWHLPYDSKNTLYYLNKYHELNNPSILLLHRDTFI
jgi:transketolase